MTRTLKDKDCFGLPNKKDCRTCAIIQNCFLEVKLRRLGVKPTKVKGGQLI